MLAFETGHFATLWKEVADKLGLEVQWVAGDWRHGVDPEKVEEALRLDTDHSIKAVLAVHTETSTGVTSRISDIHGLSMRQVIRLYFSWMQCLLWHAPSITMTTGKLM